MKKLIVKLLLLFFKKLRIAFYNFISEHQIKAIVIQPVLAKGIGSIQVSKNVHFGVERSPYFFTHYIYLDVRKASSEIVIGNNTYINNGACIISGGCKIKIGENCLFGSSLQILDSDFHDLSPANRFGGDNILKGDINIEDNVFVGNNVTILKGVAIGENSVIANGSIVSSSIPANVIAAGVPAKVIRSL